jgi:signal transduction histidine kinase
VNDRLAQWWGWYRRPAARDAVTALITTVALLFGSYGEAHPANPSDRIQNGHRVPYTPNAAFLLVAAACLVLAWRRRYPLTVLAVSTLAVVAYSAFGYVNGAVLLAPPIALFSVAQRTPLRHSLTAALATLLALGAATIFPNPFGALGGGTELLPFLVAAPLFGGIALKNRNAYVGSIQARAEDDAKRRVDDERLRIARELHDIVAHSMATINVQAGVAAHVLADNPAAAREALQVIRQSSKNGLGELRAILNVLRQADEGDPTQPAPGLGQLDWLISNAGTAGLPVTLRQSGDAMPDLPPAVDLAAYRIVQESLTNVIKHAGPAATAMVSLRHAGAGLEIEVTDTGLGPGPAAMAPGDGHGLIGMRERAASVGGSLETGPGPAGGYRVFALLPADGTHPDPADAPSADPASSAPASAS